MLDGRVYRTGLVVVLVAIVVAALSLRDGSPPLTTTLAPDAFDPGGAAAAGRQLAALGGRPRPGTAQDRRTAAMVAGRLSADGFTVTSRPVEVPADSGEQRAPAVTGVLAGELGPAIVVVADRAEGPSNTAVLLELGQVLGEETERHTIVLASVSGEAAATAAVARHLTVAPDAVLVLGRLTGRSPRLSVVGAGWGRDQAPTGLRATVAAALAAQGVGTTPGPGIAAQVVEQAFPVAVGAQAPFTGRSDPAVLISDAGAGAGHADAIVARGRAVLQAVDALDASADVARPGSFLSFGGKVVPGWAVSLVVLALILPVAATTLDAVARARRLRVRLVPGLVSTLAAGACCALVLPVLVLCRLTGVLAQTPPAPVPAGAAPVAAAALVAAALAAAVVLAALRKGCPRVTVAVAGRMTSRDEPGSVTAMAVLCAAALVLWAIDPWAAVFVLPAMHAWVWLTARVRWPRGIVLGLWLAGVSGPAAAVLAWALQARLDWPQMLQNGVLMIAQGHIGVAGVSLWSLVAGCGLSALAAAWRVADGRATVAAAWRVADGRATVAAARTPAARRATATASDAEGMIRARSSAMRPASEIVAAAPAVAAGRPRSGALALPPAERLFVLSSAPVPRGPQRRQISGRGVQAGRRAVPDVPERAARSRG